MTVNGRINLLYLKGVGMSINLDRFPRIIHGRIQLLANDRWLQENTEEIWVFGSSVKKDDHPLTNRFHSTSDVDIGLRVIGVTQDLLTDQAIQAAKSIRQIMAPRAVDIIWLGDWIPEHFQREVKSGVPLWIKGC